MNRGIETCNQAPLCDPLHLRLKGQRAVAGHHIASSEIVRIESTCKLALERSPC